MPRFVEDGASLHLLLGLIEGRGTGMRGRSGAGARAAGSVALTDSVARTKRRFFSFSSGLAWLRHAAY